MFIGVSGGFNLVNMGASVCATRVRGAWRVSVVCGVGGHNRHDGHIMRFEVCL